MALENGHYAPVTAKKVTHWPSPDKNGDGKEVWEDQYDGMGNSLGRSRVKDKDGNEVFEYEAPEGFRNIPSFDNTDNYVKVDERGRPARHPRTGEAISIRPGTTLVEHPNGDFEILADDFSRYLFEKSHERVSEPNTPDVEEPKSAEDRQREENDAEMEEFRAWKKAQSEPNNPEDVTVPKESDDSTWEDPTQTDQPASSRKTTKRGAGT